VTIEGFSRLFGEGAGAKLPDVQGAHLPLLRTALGTRPETRSRLGGPSAVRRTRRRAADTVGGHSRPHIQKSLDFRLGPLIELKAEVDCAWSFGHRLGPSCRT